jgi:hypothetical protein
MNEIFRSIELFLTYPVILFVSIIISISATLSCTARYHETKTSPQKDAVNIDQRKSFKIVKQINIIWEERWIKFQHNYLAFCYKLLQTTLKQSLIVHYTFTGADQLVAVAYFEN